MVWRMDWLGGWTGRADDRSTVPYIAGPDVQVIPPTFPVRLPMENPTGFVPATMWRTQHQQQQWVVSGRSFILNGIGIGAATRADDGEGMGSAQIGTPDAGRPHTPCDEVAGGAVYLSVVGPVTNAQTPGTQQTGSPGDPAPTDGRTRTRAHCDETGINPATRYPRHATDPGCSERWPQTSQSVCNQSGR